MTDDFMKDTVVELLKEFTAREEKVDAMLSRVRWQLGDVTKGRIINAPGTSPRSVLR